MVAIMVQWREYNLRGRSFEQSIVLIENLPTEKLPWKIFVAVVAKDL